MPRTDQDRKLARMGFIQYLAMHNDPACAGDTDDVTATMAAGSLAALDWMMQDPAPRDVEMLFESMIELGKAAAREVLMGAPAGAGTAGVN